MGGQRLGLAWLTFKKFPALRAGVAVGLACLTLEKFLRATRGGGCWLGSAGLLKNKKFSALRAGVAVGLARLAYFMKKSPRVRGPLARLGLSLVVHHPFFSAPGVASEFSEKPCECEAKASMRVFDSHMSR